VSDGLSVAVVDPGRTVTALARRLRRRKGDVDIVVTRSTISFYCEDCAHTNVKRIDLAGTRSSCDGCGASLRVPGARLQRPSARIPSPRESARLMRSSESSRSGRSGASGRRRSLRDEEFSLRRDSRRRRRSDPNEETTDLRRRRRRSDPSEETTGHRRRRSRRAPAVQEPPRRQGLLVRLAQALRLKRAS